MPNVVFIMTDTQNQGMVGAYGHADVNTPNLDRLAADGLRCDRAYTTCPLCTPARSAIFSGLPPQIAGAWGNNIAPGQNIALMGDIFSHFGFRTAYTGKWHLDGSGYFGDGVPGGGFEPDWWFDGKRYADVIGPERFAAYRFARSVDELIDAGFDDDANLWGHHVADRAIDFLVRVGDDDFVLAVSFDEPHGPSVCPSSFLNNSPAQHYPEPANLNRLPNDAPELQRIHRDQAGDKAWDDFQRGKLSRLLACNAWIDREIGRVIDAVDRLHGDDTLIVYTADHGDQMHAHGLTSKGPFMYEETTNIPFILRGPGITPGRATMSLVSHLDIIPTMCAFLDVPCAPILPGVALQPLFRDPEATVRDTALLNWHRFAINHDNWGEFYPIRCITDGRFKLSINLFDTDELYDLQSDPAELHNRIHDDELAPTRDALHDYLLEELDDLRDPFRSWRWGSRPWRDARRPFYHGGQRRNHPGGWPFQSEPIEAHG